MVKTSRYGNATGSLTIGALGNSSHLLLIQTFLLKDLLDHERRWNVTFIRNNFNITKDVEDMLKMYIPIQSIIEKRFLTNTKNGQVTFKSSYRVLTTKNSGLRKWKDIWGFPIPQRIIPFGWKCLRKAIPIRSFITFKLKSFIASCLICDCSKKSVEHVMLRCDHAGAI